MMLYHDGTVVSTTSTPPVLESGNLQHNDIGRSTTETREDNEDAQAQEVHCFAPKDISKLSVDN